MSMRTAIHWTLLVASAAALGACRGGPAVSTTNPNDPFYRNPQADFASIRSLAVRFVNVTTSNQQGVEIVEQTFLESCQTHLGPLFGPVSMDRGEEIPEDGAVLELNLQVGWGSRAARYLVGFGAGRASITFDYKLKDAQGNVLSHMSHADTMSGGAWGGNAKGLVFSASNKWTQYFAAYMARHPAGG